MERPEDSWNRQSHLHSDKMCRLSSSRCDPNPGSLNGGRGSVLGWSANRKLAEIASMNTIRIRLGHESLDVPLAYLKGKDAESEEAQEHANSSSLALNA